MPGYPTAAPGYPYGVPAPGGNGRGWYPGPPQPPWGAAASAQPRRSYLWPVLTTLLVFCMVLALGGAAAAAWALRSDDDSAPVASTWVDLRPEAGGKAVDAILARHAEAVRKKDSAEWMADVDQSDPAFVKRQKQLFDNLTKMPFAQLSFERATVSVGKMAKLLPTQLFDRYHAAVRVIPVTVVHRIEGVDSRSVATPWLPVFGFAGGKWLIAGDGAGNDLPLGAGGQPWDAAGPVTVVRDDRVVAVLSGDDAGRGKTLLQLAEAGLKQVAEVRPAGWDGKVLLTAVHRQADSSTPTSPSRRTGWRRSPRSPCRITTRSPSGPRAGRRMRRPRVSCSTRHGALRAEGRAGSTT